MDEYRTAFEQLNIPQDVFDQIIADEGARGEICECLMLCLTSVPSLREVASALLQYIAYAGSSHSFDDEKWITINGTHVAVEEGSGEITKGPAALKEVSAKKTGSDTPKRGESAFTPRIKDYAFEYEDEYTDGPVRISDLDPSEQYEYWRQLNMEKLRGLYREERKKEKETGVRRPDFQETVYHEWYGSKTENVTPDTVQEMSLEQAKDVLWDAIPDNVASGWLREANSAYKPRLVDCVIATPETRAAALNVMYENFKFFHGEGTSFEEFLTTPVRMYRGGQGQKHVAEDVFSAYTFDRKIAEKFAGKGGTVYEASIRPIDTWGSLRDNGEAEIMVPSWIAPNGNHDNADGGPGSGNHGHAGVPGQVGGSAPSGITAVSDSCFPTDRYRIDPNQGWNAERSSYLSGKGFSDGAIKKLSDLTTAHIRGQEPEAEMKKFISENRDLVMAAASYETAAAQKRREYEIAEADKAIASAKEELEAVNRGEYDWMGPREYALQDAEDRLRSCESHRKKLDEPVKLYRKGGYEDTCLSFTTDHNGVVLNAGTDYETYLTPDHEATLQELESQGIFPIGGFGAYFNFYSGEGTEVTFVRVPAVNQDGGPGSGNFGHAGVPGQVGGSAPGNGMTAEESAKVTSGLNDSLKKAVSSAKTREEKYYAAKKVISEAPVGSCVKVGFFEARKVVDGASPDEPAYSTGYDDTPSKSLSDLMHLVDYSGWGFEPEFVDGVAKKAQAREAVAQMREAGKISGSDEVRKGEEGLISSGSSKYGQPGSYAIYRTGEVSENGMVFFATTKEGADTYASQHDNKTSQYRAVLKNPLVVEGTGDGECLAKAHEILTGKKISGGLTDTKWIAADRQNASALASSGYDSIIYVVNGRPTEVQIPGATARSMTENIGTYSTTEWSRLGKTIEGAVYDDSFKQQPTDYKRLDGKNLDSSEKPLDFKAQSATIKSRDQHHDADDVDWITVNGAHIPLKDGTAVGGGALEGQDFSAASSTSSSPSLAKAHWPDDFPKVTVHTNLQTLRHVNPERHHAAKHGDTQAAKEIIAQCVKMERVEELANKYPDAKVVPVRGGDTEEGNQIPMTFASCFEAFGLEVEDGIVQTKKAGHTDSDQFHRLMSRPEFDGKVEPGREYILVDDHVTNGGTLSDLRKYIVSNGGKVVAISTLSASQGGTYIAIQKKTVDQIRAKHGEGIDSLLRKGGIAYDVESLTDKEGRYILSMNPDTLKRRIEEDG